ncbi:MAG: HlyC/CorC family transporter [Candidatus Omnitrophica bacterium]|nr:HlyC/CorC family transporter [Candidatus Omnitrophota bacterium]
MTEGVPFLLLAALFLLAAFFAGSETALFSLTRIERRRLVERYPRLGGLVNDLLAHPRRVLVTLLIGNNLTHILAAVLVTLVGLRWVGPGRVSLVVAIFTVALIFFGEVLPKVVAVRKNESLAILAAPLLEFLSGLLFPLRRLVQFLSDGVLSFLLRDKKESSDLISAQELKLLVKIGEEEGILDRQERRMIQKLFELGERPVRSIMTHRTDLVALRLGDPWEKQEEVMKRFHYSHFPVYQDSLDQITGVVTTQEVILSGQRDLTKFLKPAFYVPALKRIDELLRDFQKTGAHFAVCVDEFGGTAGVVTLEDILEEIFGEFYDEYAKPEQAIREGEGGEYLVDGKISLGEFNEFFHGNLRSKEAATLSGFVLEKMGRVPKKGDLLEIPHFRLRIHDMARQRILKIGVRPQR